MIETLAHWLKSVVSFLALLAILIFVLGLGAGI